MHLYPPPPTHTHVLTRGSKRTRVDFDAVAAACRKVCQIHRRLPAGGILVFLTGQVCVYVCVCV
jgi:HrpA-like RNA helicase